ncbi:nuclease-related domain-containing protein [Flagellimonas sp.]|uniref:nuclease-related domain-containing protein n=1 Tax=Flagellimonas sp. TaxID=2058762 RepID=UPI003BAC5B29
MAIIHGKIECLKRIKETLETNGITHFNSTGDIKRFKKNYPSLKEDLVFNVEKEYESELDTHQIKLNDFQKEYETLKEDVESKLNSRLEKLETKCNTLNTVTAKNAVFEILNWYQFVFLKGVHFVIKTNFNLIVNHKTRPSKKALESFEEKVHRLQHNRNEIISKRLEPKFNQLKHTKTVVDSLNNLIAGAIGENLVEKELSKLSDNFVLINDFSIQFDKPIYNRKERDRIYSIQIDHLLVTNGAIFIIETKNWSKKSVENIDLRSPIKQIKRTNYALFTILNSNSSSVKQALKKHHWGSKQLPVKSVVVLINHKPEQKFKFVAIKRLDELNDYINYFEPIFDESEVSSISKLLIRMNGTIS